MANTSPSETALELLNQCLRGKTWPPDLLDSLIGMATASDPDRARAGSQALFSILVEHLADLFDPELCDVYSGLFSHVIASVLPELKAPALVERYRRVRAVRAFQGDVNSVRNVFVLSRVTLGADVAVTSVMLDAAKRQFPESEILLVGPRKNWELFNADPRIKHVPMSYGRRGHLLDCLGIYQELSETLSQPESIVLDPDSRLTQLGLLPVCPEENYYFFESRAYGSMLEASLPELARQWVAETLGVADAWPFIAPAEQPEAGEKPIITVSLGVGGNPAKRIPDPFESNILRGLVRDDATVVIDRGAGGEEARRVEKAISLNGAPPGQIRAWGGSFAGFASLIERSRLYVGYDSAGQHVAAACGVPLVSVFAGFPSPRMFDRWRPTGQGRISVIRVEQPDPDKVLVDALGAIYRL